MRAVGRERTDTEKRRRHLYGDAGAKFNSKRLCLLGDIITCITTFTTKDNLVCEIYDGED